MPLGKELKKFGKKVEKETNRVAEQVTAVVKNTRNEISDSVNSYKNELSKIGAQYNDDYAFIKILNSTTGELEDFKWDWLTSTTRSHSTQVNSFKKIIEALVEAKDGSDKQDVTNKFKDYFSKLDLSEVVSFVYNANNLNNTSGSNINIYGNSVTALEGLQAGHYPAKLGDIMTEELFTKYNIYYKEFWSRITPNTDLLNEANGFCQQEKFTTNQAELVAKVFREGLHCKLLNDVTDEFKTDFPKLDLNGVATLMHILKAKDINIDGAISNALPANYPAIWENISAKDFLEKYDIANPYRSFESKIEQNETVQPSIQNAETSALTLENSLGYRVAKQEEKNREKADEEKQKALENSLGYRVAKQEEKNREKADEEKQKALENSLGYDVEKQQKKNEKELLLKKVLENTTKANDSSSENSKVLLGEKVKLTNGAEFGVKNILNCLDKKPFVQMVLEEVTPETRQLLEDEMILQAVYNVNQGRISKKDAGSIITSYDCLTSKWLDYNDFTDKEIQNAEVGITGGPSYIE